MGHVEYKELSCRAVDFTVMTIGENAYKTLENIMANSNEAQPH